jgi:hypothetical protein
MTRAHPRTFPVAAALGLAACLAAGCDDGRAHARAVCVLIDVSGTYADQRAEVVRIVKSGLLPRVRPGDSFFVIRIEDASYGKESLEASANLDAQPSHANAQKLAIAAKLDRFAESGPRARHTDISGALLLAAEYLREARTGKKSVVVFSDMKEELPRGAQRSFRPDELAGVEILALNVKRLASDKLDPAGYRGRLEGWGTRLAAAGASRFTVVQDPEELASLLEAR